MSKPPAGCHSADAAQHAVSHFYKINIDFPNRHLFTMSSHASPDNSRHINHQTEEGEQISDTIKHNMEKMRLW